MKKTIIFLSLAIWIGNVFIFGTTVTPHYIVVDDYMGESQPGREWYYSRIATDRGIMGEGAYIAHLGGGKASVIVQSGWGGVWTALMHNANANDPLNPTQLIGPYIKNQYQPFISGIEVDILDGFGTFIIELKNINNDLIAKKNSILIGGPTTLQFQVNPNVNIAKLNWLVSGSGYAEVKRVRLQISSPTFSISEAVFLFSYGHLCQCYDADSGLVRDRASWPVEDFAAVPSTGLFALVTAIAANLGYVDNFSAQTIIQKTKATILGLPRYKELLPHFLKNGNISPDTEWSSVDTAITLISEILACQAIGEDASELEAILKAIDWADLTGNGVHSISHGYFYNGQQIPSTWDTFGSEALIAAIAYSAATGDNQVKLDLYSYPPTWDGSGFNDELAALFFPATGSDIWGNDWYKYRYEAFNRQINYTFPTDYSNAGLFGLSAIEVPEPWTVAEDDIYQVCGVGGHNNQTNDGTTIVGYPIIAPHYAAMVASEHIQYFENLFHFLLETQEVFTPLNNVESLGIGSGSGVVWNSLKGSWNLSLQVLGAGRALSKNRYLPYEILKDENCFLARGFYRIMPSYIRLISPNLIFTHKSVTGHRGWMR